MEIGVTVIICCYNSAPRLQSTLNHLLVQKTDYAWELIIVNNNSTDKTEQYAHELLYKSAINYTIINQPIQGLDAARKKGIENAKYEYLVFCDDDNWLDSNYIQNVVLLFKEHPNSAILGGLNTPAFEIPPPNWISQYIGGYACGIPSNERKSVSSVFGAGMAIRKSVINNLFDIGFITILSDRSKNNVSSGNDSEICKVCTMAGYGVWYDERLQLQHFIPKQRLEWGYCKSLFAGFGESHVLLQLYDFASKSESAPKSLSNLFWIKKMVYYILLLCKYYPKYYKDLNIEGSGKSILYLSWKLQAKAYWRLKWDINRYYERICTLNKKLTKKKHFTS